ncbi:protein FAM166C isoform X3 [Monodelphis domestica]|uniref:protein FAM166C isoform X3 n=1 Tax=Monodelphis domestica TaxID=13616 RepID=UPI00044362D5|nr:protein FAM166C isoform X3 [Monodelphis domestica]
MASRAAGTLLTGNNACYVPPSLMPGYQGHIPNVSFSFGDTYGNTTLKYFQDNRNAAMDTSYSPYSKGGQFPTLYSRNPNLALGYRAHAWDRWLHTPTYTRFNLDCHRSEELRKFYQLVQMHREYYQDKTGTVNRVPYFVLPMEEKDHYPLPTDQSSTQKPAMVQSLNYPPRP